MFTGPGVEPDTLNPLLTQESDVADLATLYEGVLFQIDDHDRLVPELATTIPSKANGGISPDGLTITYHLRRGVRWQDGVPVTSADVAFSYRAVMNPANDVSPRMGYDRIASVTTPDRWTVVLRMKRPYSPIVAQFGNYPYYPIVPAHVLARYPNINDVPYNSEPIGAGPYEVAQWDRGDRLILQANPFYWRGPPAIKTLIFRFIPNANTAAAQLETHELDAWFNADPNAYPTLLQGHVPVQLHSMNDIHMLLFNLRDPVLGDVRVREAIAAALDRERMIRAVVHGLGVAIPGDQPTFSWAYSVSRDAVGYDPSRANALLDAAGWRPGPDGVRVRDGRRLTLQLAGTTDVTAWNQVAAIVQDALRRIGIAVTVKTYPAGLYFGAPEAGGILQSGKYQLAYDAHLLALDPNDLEYYGCDQFPPAGGNYVFWCDRTADRAIHDALASYDRNRRKRDYAVVQERLARDVPMLALWQVVRVDAFSRPLENFSPSPAGPTFWNAWRWRLAPPHS